MEAFIVPPIQPQTAPTPTTQTIGALSDETSFAPALNQAISTRIRNNPQDSSSQTEHNFGTKNPEEEITLPTDLPNATERSLENIYAMHSEMQVENLEDSSLHPDLSLLSTEPEVVFTPLAHSLVDTSLAPVDNNLATEQLQSYSAEAGKTIQPVFENQYFLQGNNTQFIFGESNPGKTGDEQVLFIAKEAIKGNVVSESESLHYRVKLQQQNPLQTGVIKDSNPTVLPTSINETAITGKLFEKPQLFEIARLSRNGHFAEPVRAELSSQPMKTELSSRPIKTELSSQPLKNETISVAVEQLTKLQKNDTVIVTQNKPLVPHVIAQRQDIHIAQATVAETVKATPSVSTENILANLAQPSLKTEFQPLRNDNAPLRHDISGQYLNSAIERQSFNTDQTFSQQQFEFEGDTQNQQQQLSTSAKPGETATETTFTQSLSQSSVDKPAISPSDTMRPGMPAFSSFFAEDNILNQVMQRFRLSQNLADTKLVMKLHPAELGELKVDVQLKNGSINANFVAQNQQVQEILEKNLPRLREMMEQQGLTVDDIVIKLDADLEADYNMFKDQLAQDESSTANKKNRNSNANFTLNPESELSDEEHILEDDSVVNVKV